MKDKDPVAKAAEAMAKTHPPRLQVAHQDLAKLRGTYPVAGVSQLEGLTSHQTEAFSEAIRANSQVLIQFAPKSPSE